MVDAEKPIIEYAKLKKSVMKKNYLLVLLVLTNILCCIQANLLYAQTMPFKVTQTLDLDNYSEHQDIILKAITDGKSGAHPENTRTTKESLAGGTKYARITLSKDSMDIDLLYRTKDLYLIGFYAKNDTLYHFNNEVGDPALPDVPKYSLGYSGGYTLSTGIGFLDNIKFNNFINYFISLSNFRGKNPDKLKNALSGIVFITSESWRFYSIFNYLGNFKPDSELEISDFKTTVNNWVHSDPTSVNVRTFKL